MLSIRTRAWSVVSTGVLPRLMTCLGPRTEVAGLVARIPPVTSQSNSMRMRQQSEDAFASHRGPSETGITVARPFRPALARTGRRSGR
jgi:hypothetical protein